MSEPYLGEIRRFPYEMLPDGWLACDGQEVPSAQYAALHDVIANTYGGQAGSTFALPDLRGAVAVSQGGNAGPLGSSVFGPGPQAPFQTVCFAIAAVGIYPSPPSASEKN